MLRLWCIVAALWLLLFLAAYRHDLFPPPALGSDEAVARAVAVAPDASRVCVAPISVGDRRLAQHAASACSGRGGPSVDIRMADDARSAAATPAGGL